MTYLSLFEKIKFNCFCGGYSAKDLIAKPIHKLTEDDGDTQGNDAGRADEDQKQIEKHQTQRNERETKKKRRRSRENARMRMRSHHHRYKIYDEVANVGKQYNITILPVYAGFCIENLYPETNQVHKWNTIIIGKDKTFILVSLHDLDLPQHETFPNRRSGNVLDRQLQDFFDPIFDRTLQNKQLQFVMAWSQNIFLVNSYPICNQIGNVIGAVLFIRNYDLMPKMTYTTPFVNATEDVRDDDNDKRY